MSGEFVSEVALPPGFRGECLIGGRRHLHPNLFRCFQFGHEITARGPTPQPERYQHGDSPEHSLVIVGDQRGRFCDEIDEWVGQVHEHEGDA